MAPHCLHPLEKSRLLARVCARTRRAVAFGCGARVGIVDAYRPTSEHGTPPDLLRCELAAVGYREISLDRLTGSDAYLAIFAPPSVASRTRPDAMVTCK